MSRTSTGIPHTPAIFFIAVASLVSACDNSQAVRQELEKKEGCTILSLEKREGGGFEYVLECEGNRECSGNMTIESSFGSSSQSSFESCRLSDKACTDDDAMACARVGSHYVSRDSKRAREFYDRGCNNDAEVCRAIGNEYFDTDKKLSQEYYGRGCKKPSDQCVFAGDKFLTLDEAAARKFYDSACEASGEACFHAALKYEKSKYEETKAEVATSYYERGCKAEPKSHPSCFNRALELATDETDKASMVKARAYYQTACDGGHGGACNNLGLLWANGKGGPRNDKTALEMLGKGCAQDSENACKSLTTNCAKGYKLACSELERAKKASAKTD